MEINTSEFIYKLAAGEEELKGALGVRRSVFTEEQGITGELDVDGRDNEALHMVVKHGERIIATARVIFPTAVQAKIERMAVLKPHRRQGIGTGIITFLAKELKGKGINQLFLHAQWPVIAFYKQNGFREQSSSFIEAGIKHIGMLKLL